MQNFPTQDLLEENDEKVKRLEYELSELDSYRKELLKQLLQTIQSLAPNSTQPFIDEENFNRDVLLRLCPILGKDESVVYKAFYGDDFKLSNAEDGTGATEIESVAPFTVVTIEGVVQAAAEKASVHIKNPVLETGKIKRFKRYGKVAHQAIVSLVQHEFKNVVGAAFQGMLTELEIFKRYKDRPDIYLSIIKPIREQNIEQFKTSLLFLKTVISGNVKNPEDILDSIPISGQRSFGDYDKEKGIKQIIITPSEDDFYRQDPINLFFDDSDILSMLLDYGKYDAYFVSVLIIRTLLDNFLKEDRNSNGYIKFQLYQEDGKVYAVLSMFDDTPINVKMHERVNEGAYLAQEESLEFGPEGGLRLASVISNRFGGSTVIKDVQDLISFNGGLFVHKFVAAKVVEVVFHVDPKPETKKPDVTQASDSNSEN